MDEINSTGPIELLMIDSKWELRRCEFEKKQKEINASKSNEELEQQN